MGFCYSLTTLVWYLVAASKPEDIYFFLKCQQKWMKTKTALSHGFLLFTVKLTLVWYLVAVAASKPEDIYVFLKCQQWMKTNSGVFFLFFFVDGTKQSLIDGWKGAGKYGGKENYNIKDVECETLGTNLLQYIPSILPSQLSHFDF